jgi:hypothetical protein
MTWCKKPPKPNRNEIHLSAFSHRPTPQGKSLIRRGVAKRTSISAVLMEPAGISQFIGVLSVGLEHVCGRKLMGRSLLGKGLLSLL